MSRENKSNNSKEYENFSFPPDLPGAIPDNRDGIIMETGPEMMVKREQEMLHVKAQEFATEVDELTKVPADQLSQSKIDEIKQEIKKTTRYHIDEIRLPMILASFGSGGIVALDVASKGGSTAESAAAVLLVGTAGTVIVEAYAKILKWLDGLGKEEFMIRAEIEKMIQES